jgi:hypothetical protein
VVALIVKPNLSGSNAFPLSLPYLKNCLECHYLPRSSCLWSNQMNASPELFLSVISYSFQSYLDPATHMDAIHGRNPGRRAIWHRLEAIGLVNQQLADPVLSVSDNTIVTISSLMATEVSSLPMPQENEMHADQWVRSQRI